MRPLSQNPKQQKIHPFHSMLSCPACGHIGDPETLKAFQNKPLINFVLSESGDELLKKKCSLCEYSWFERILHDQRELDQLNEKKKLIRIASISLGVFAILLLLVLYFK